MLGAVIGDIAGSIYEFNNTRDYNFKMFSSASDFTDDTIMTMAVAQWAMTDTKNSQDALERSMLSFANEYPSPKGGYGEAFSKWLFHPEMLTDYSNKYRRGVRAPYNSWGNGSAMRVSAIGWLYGSIEETERIAAMSAQITHNHPEGIKGAQAVAAAVFLARNGKSKGEIREYVSRRFGYNLNDDWKHLHATYSWNSSCQGTVPQAIIAFLDSSDFESAIRMAVSMGGDSDTLACITGAIAEAYYKEMPEYMVSHALSLLPGRLRMVLDRMGKTGYSICYDKYMQHYWLSHDFTPERISSLQENEVFVFGSNIHGQHGGGAARLAYNLFGAEWGVGVGMTGQSYAIPTMQGGVETIRPYVDQFTDFAERNPHKRFLVTKIGCGIAGFAVHDIAPLFVNCIALSNVVLPKEFYTVIHKYLGLNGQLCSPWKVNWLSERVPELFLEKEKLEQLQHGMLPPECEDLRLIKLGNWFYLVSKRHWLKKFRFSSLHDGRYRLTDSYSCADELGRNRFMDFIMND